MPVEVSVQLSLGRFPLLLHEEDTIRAVKAKLRTTYATKLLQVNVNAFRVNVNGKYLSDESKKVKDLSIAAGDVLHFVKKHACAYATLDTEVPADE